MIRCLCKEKFTRHDRMGVAGAAISTTYKATLIVLYGVISGKVSVLPRHDCICMRGKIDNFKAIDSQGVMYVTRQRLTPQNDLSRLIIADHPLKKASRRHLDRLRVCAMAHHPRGVYDKVPASKLPAPPIGGICPCGCLFEMYLS
jgi:hypothetical protein